MEGSQAHSGAQPTKKYKLRVHVLVDLHHDLTWVLTRILTMHDFQSLMSKDITKLEADISLRKALDGQAVLTEWYLSGVSHEERVDRHQRLKKLVHTGQLEIGPAYVVPDEFLAPEMALVQDLRIGHEVTAGYADEFLFEHEKVPRFLDRSDTFGHVAQMPQIVAPFADFVYFSRGLAGTHSHLVILRWSAPNGTSVIGIPQQGGYQSAGEFGRADVAASLAIVENFLQLYLPRYEAAGVQDIQMSVRRDFKGIPENLQEHLEAVREQYPDIEFIIDTNADYARAIKPYVTDDLPVLRGELAGSGDRFILRGVNSMRMPLKLANERVYRAFMSTETIASLAMLKLRKKYYYPRHDMLRLWSGYLELQSHDSITGCHSDQVFDEMIAKFRDIEAELDWIKQKALAELSGHEAKHNHDNHIGRAATKEFGLINLTPYQRNAEVVLVQLPPRMLGHKILRATVGPTQQERTPVEIQRTAHGHAAITVSTGCLGSVSVLLEQNTHAEEPPVPERLGVITSDRLRVEMNPNGLLTMTDLESGRRYEGLHRFESEGDGGDTYTCAPVSDRFYDGRGEHATVKHLSNGPLVWEMEISQTLHLPQRLHRRDRETRIGDATVEVRTLIRLRRGSRQAEFDTKLANSAEDHRLRVVFPVGETVPSSRAQTAFMVNEYPVQDPHLPDWKNYTQDKEPPFTAITNQGLVIVGSLFSANRGITEYEARNAAGDTELCLTLLRCVSHLSQGDLSSRRGQAGPGNLLVPRAQCHGEHNFSYTLGLVGEATDVELAQSAQAWRNGFEPTFADIDTNGIVSVDCGQTVFSSLMLTRDAQFVDFISYAGADPAEVTISGDISAVERVDLAGKPLPRQTNQVEPFGIGVHRLCPRS